MQTRSRRVFALQLAMLFWGILLVFANPSLAGAVPQVVVSRVPDRGVQPQIAMSGDGVLHLIYLKGDPSHSDIFYVRSPDNGGTWSHPVRVNSQPGSALAIGTVRGAHLALGRGGQIHVAWMGSNLSTPKAPGDATPMLYSRSTDDGKSFEPQRNVIQSSPGLDGGGSIAADQNGHVYVAWHAPAPGKKGEQFRRVWISKSMDGGATFAPEVAVSEPSTGACGCCGMRLFAVGGRVIALYRGAAQQVHRGMYLIDCSSDLKESHSTEIAPMEFGVCVMSTSALAQNGGGAVAAWETRGRVFWSQLSSDAPTIVHPHEIDSRSSTCKHPAIAADGEGHLLVVWTEETGWNKGGTIAWEVFDSTGTVLPGATGRAADLPTWDSPAAIWCSNKTLLVLY